MEFITAPNHNRDADAEAILPLRSFNTLELGKVFAYAVFKQASENIPRILATLSRELRYSSMGYQDKRSDLLFYFSAFYARCLLLDNPSWSFLKSEDDVPIVAAFIPVLQQYVEARGTSDPDPEDRKSTRLNSSHSGESRMPSSA